MSDHSNILNTLLIFSVSFFVTIIFIFVLRPFSKKFKIIDEPSERKVHKGKIPLIGGISIFFGVYISIFGQLIDNNIFLGYMLSAFLILLLGFIDDCHPLSAKVRILIQIIIVTSVVLFTKLKFETIGHSFGFDKQIDLGLFSYPITILGLVFVTNAFNLMDGADGIAGSLAILALIGINFNKLIAMDYNFNFLSVAIFAGLLPYLWFNIFSQAKKKIFLGDSGSLFLGYSIAFLLLYETQVQNNISPPFALWIIAIPVFDTISVMAYRLNNYQSLFIPDRNHLHHFLLTLFLSNTKVLLGIIGSGLFLLLIAFFLEKYAQPISFYIFLLFLIFYLWIRVFSKFSKI